jgi:hypothetical protein
MWMRWFRPPVVNEMELVVPSPRRTYTPCHSDDVTADEERVQPVPTMVGGDVEARTRTNATSQ